MSNLVKVDRSLLIADEEVNIIKLFDKEYSSSLVSSIKEAVSSIYHDDNMKLAKNRAALRSTAARVAKTKAFIEKQAKILESEARKKIKALQEEISPISSAVKLYKKELDDLRDLIKAPALNYDAAKKKADKDLDSIFEFTKMNFESSNRAREFYDYLVDEEVNINKYKEFGLYDSACDVFERTRESISKQIESLVEREELKVQVEAGEKQRRDDALIAEAAKSAEIKAEREKIELENQKKLAEERAERAEKEKIENEKRHALELEKQSKLELERIEKEKLEREKNKAHTKAVNNEILSEMLKTLENESIVNQLATYDNCTADEMRAAIERAIKPIIVLAGKKKLGKLVVDY